MRPRTELALASGLFLLLGLGAVALGSRRSRPQEDDERRSTFLSGPAGARGYADGLTRLGVTVERHRRPLGTLERVIGGAPRTLVALLGPTVGLTAAEGADLAQLPVDLLLSGPGAAWAIRCFGYRVVSRQRDSLPLLQPEGSEARPLPWVRAVLAQRSSPVATDSSGGSEARPVTCVAPAALRVDTLLRATGGRPVVIRLALARDRTVTLVADDGLFSNRALRETAAGPFALGLVVPAYQRLVVDEYHHGYHASGSLAGAALAWSLRSPWGWAVWQCAIVGLVALFGSAVRFGPIRALIPRRRRSTLEHVRALATALAASRGHEVAVRLVIRGLRRRLSRAGRPTSGEGAVWLESLLPAIRTDRGREALHALSAINRRRASTDDVLQAAHAVETLWEELKPA